MKRDVVLTFYALILTLPSQVKSDDCVQNTSAFSCSFPEMPIFNKFCNWTTGGWEYQTSYSQNLPNLDKSKYIQLRGLEGTLNSILMACATTTTTTSAHCLTFQYYFGGTSNKASLQVLLKMQDGTDFEKVIFNATPSTSQKAWHWINASVPIHEPANFYIAIKGTRSADETVDLDNIGYFPRPCSVFPPEAAVTQVSSTSTTLPVNATAAPDTGSRTTGNVGTVVGSVVGVLGVAAAAVLIFILFRRRVFDSCRRRPTETRKDCSQVKSTSLPNPSGDGSQERTDKSIQHEMAESNHKPPANIYNIPSEQQRESNYYSTIPITDVTWSKGDNHLAKLAARADGKKPTSGHRETQRCKHPLTKKMEGGDYSEIVEKSLGQKLEFKETGDESQNAPGHTSAEPVVDDNECGTYHVIGADANKEEYMNFRNLNGKSHSSNGLQATTVGCAYCEEVVEDNECGTYHVLENGANTYPDADENESYRSLDFEGKAFGVNTANPRQSEAQYSHLNNQNEDAYNELKTANQRRLVIDGEYSHLDGS